jgi:hypothetical protein
MVNSDTLIGFMSLSRFLEDLFADFGESRELFADMKDAVNRSLQILGG